MKRDPSWVKSRIFARILLRRDSGILAPRDIRLLARLECDRAVTNRLLDQALASICAQKKISYEDVVARLSVAA